jgi:hypothetical protein
MFDRVVHMVNLTWSIPPQQSRPPLRMLIEVMPCPDEDEIAALVISSDSSAARDHFLRHCADCESCHTLWRALGADDMSLGELLVGRCTSEYLLESLAGRGGGGVVYRARDLALQRSVAVKLLLPPAAGPGDQPSPTQPPTSAVEARFLREALITARLQHPSIVPVYQGGRWPTGEPFYTMRLMSGRSLKEVIADAGDLAARLALLPRLIAVAEAVAYAHSEGVIHRDLKPANIASPMASASPASPTPATCSLRAWRATRCGSCAGAWATTTSSTAGASTSGRAASSAGTTAAS